jgi:hypothetical protein
LPLQYIWTNESKDLFVKELQTDEAKQKLNEFLSNSFSGSKNDVEKCVDEFQNILLHTSKKSLKIKKKKYRHISENVETKNGLIKIVEFNDII